MNSLQFQFPEFQISLKTKAKPSQLFQVSKSEDIAKVCRIIFDADTIEWCEQFIVIALNRANKVIGYYKLSQGGLTGTVADPRMIMQFALLSNAVSIVICHNHPSGNLQPSRGDEEVTQKIKNAAALLDIKLLDHVILTSESYYSFSDEGII